MFDRLAAAIENIRALRQARLHRLVRLSETENRHKAFYVSMTR